MSIYKTVQLSWAYRLSLSLANCKRLEIIFINTKSKNRYWIFRNKKISSLLHGYMRKLDKKKNSRFISNCLKDIRYIFHFIGLHFSKYTSIFEVWTRYIKQPATCVPLWRRSRKQNSCETVALVIYIYPFPTNCGVRTPLIVAF